MSGTTDGVVSRVEPILTPICAPTATRVLPWTWELCAAAAVSMKLLISGGVLGHGAFDAKLLVGSMFQDEKRPTGRVETGGSFAIRLTPRWRADNYGGHRSE